MMAECRNERLQATNQPDVAYHAIVHAIYTHTIDAIYVHTESRQCA